MPKQFAKQFYRSKQWEQTRAYILLRDNYLCQICGRPAEEVHHKIHLNAKNVDDPRVSMNPDNLVSLCRDCHQAQHTKDRARGNRKSKEPELEYNYDFDENGQLIQTPPGQNFANTTKETDR